MTLEGPGGIANAAFSHDGGTLAWGNENALVVWRAPSWAENPHGGGEGESGRINSHEPNLRTAKVEFEGIRQGCNGVQPGRSARVVSE